MKTVLASRPGAIQASLRATLGSFPQITVSSSASGGLSALNKVREDRPSLLVIDGALSEGEVAQLLIEAKRADAQLRCIVLVDTVREGQSSLAAGADMVLMRDSLSGHLLEAMREMGLIDTSQDVWHESRS